MTALDDIQSLLNAMRDRGAEIDAFKSCLSEIAHSMADIVLLMEKPEAPEAPEEEDKVLLALIEHLQIPPAVVNVAASPPIINVAPSTVQVIQAPSAPVSWKLAVTKRDDMGNMREITIKQE